MMRAIMAQVCMVVTDDMVVISSRICVDIREAASEAAYWTSAIDSLEMRYARAGRHRDMPILHHAREPWFRVP